MNETYKQTVLKDLNNIRQMFLEAEDEDTNDDTTNDQGDTDNDFNSGMDAGDSPDNEDDESQEDLEDSISNVTSLRKVYDAIILTKSILDNLLLVLTEPDIVEMRQKLEQFHSLFNTFVNYYSTFPDDKKKKVIKLLRSAIVVYLTELTDVISRY